MNANIFAGVPIEDVKSYENHMTVAAKAQNTGCSDTCIIVSKL